MKWIQAASGNYQKGRQGKKVDTIVLHWIVGKLSAADAVFTNPSYGTSAHYAVGGTEIHQYVKEEDTAYHAGNFDVNLRSIGIEHEGGPTIPISEATYKTSAKLVSEVSKRHGIPLDRAHVKGHKEIKATQCPGTLDIDRVIRDAKALSQTRVDFQAQLDQLRKERDDNHLKYLAEKKRADEQMMLTADEKKRRMNLEDKLKRIGEILAA